MTMEFAPGPIGIRVAVRNDPVRRRAVVDFTGTDAQVPGGLNAVYAITWSAVFYVFRCLLPADAIATAGLMRPVRVIAPEGSIVNAMPPAAVAGGNVETSQRIVDTAFEGACTSASRSHSGRQLRHDEQSDDRWNRSALWPAVYLLRDHRRWSGSIAVKSRRKRSSRAHDQLAQHAG